MCEKITLIANGKILTTDEDIAERFNNHFTNITDSLDIGPYYKEVHKQLNIDQMVLRAIDKYKDDPSIRAINQHVIGNIFKFSHVSPTEVMKQIDLLDINKSSGGNIAIETFKAMRGIACPYIDLLSQVSRRNEGS